MFIDLNFQITLGDGLPEQICTQCADKAVQLYLFKENCERADAALRQQLGKSPFVDHFNNKGKEHDDDDDEFHINNEESSENIIVRPEINLENEDGSSLEGAIENSVEIYSVFNVNSDDVICDVCDKKFKSNQELSKHYRKMHMPKPFVCETCGRSFTRDDLLLRHKIIHAIKMQHNNTTEPTTTVKHKQIDDDDDDEIPVREEETIILENSATESATLMKADNDNNLCKICNKRFSKVAHLNRHTKIHAAIKPYSCELCKKGFARAEQLMNHRNVHSGIKPHVCKICSKGTYIIIITGILF